MSLAEKMTVDDLLEHLEDVDGDAIVFVGLVGSNGEDKLCPISNIIEEKHIHGELTHDDVDALGESCLLIFPER